MGGWEGGRKEERRSREGEERKAKEAGGERRSETEREETVITTYSPSGRAANLLLLIFSVMSCFNWHREGVRVVMLLNETSRDVKDDSNDTSVL